MEEIKKARKAVVEEALKEVRNGSIIGIGSGTTIKLLLEELAVKNIKVKVIPSSYQSYLLALKHGIEVTSLDEKPRPELYLDSFDQVDEMGNMIKGGGAALLREKIVCYASERRVFIGDFKKTREKLNMPIPLEVLPFSLGYVLSELSKIGGKAIVREGGGKVGPVISDNGNIIVDVDFGEITNPRELEEKLDRIPGVLESGLFTSCADRILIGYADGKIKEIQL